MAVVLSESRGRTEVVQTARLVLEADVIDVVLPTPVNPGPVPIRSTGASQAIAGRRAALGALTAADFIADCTVEGPLHAPELGAVLESGARVPMISNEHPEHVERWPHDPSLADRVAEGVPPEAASVMTVSSAAGSDLTINLDGAVRAGSHGWSTEPGSIAHWPGGLVLAFPAGGSVNGTLVLSPGDVNLTFKSYVRTPVRITIVDDYITDIDGGGLDPASSRGVDGALFAAYLDASGEADARAVSHVGWV